MAMVVPHAGHGWPARPYTAMGPLPTSQPLRVVRVGRVRRSITSPTTSTGDATLRAVASVVTCGRVVVVVRVYR